MNLNSDNLHERAEAVLFLTQNGFRPLGHGEFVKGNDVYNFNYINLNYLKEIEEKGLFITRKLYQEENLKPGMLLKSRLTGTKFIVMEPDPDYNVEKTCILNLQDGSILNLNDNPHTFKYSFEIINNDH